MNHKSKLCPHIIEGYNGALHMRTAQGLYAEPAIIKLVNPSLTYIREVRELYRESLLVIRFTEEESWQIKLKDPENYARQWVSNHSQLINAAKSLMPIAFEGVNEVPDDYAELAVRAELTRLRLLHELNAYGSYLNSSVGTPDFPVWSTYEPVLAAMDPRFEYIGMHAYWSDYNNLLLSTWHFQRWRMIKEHTKGRKIILSEIGSDYLPDINTGGGAWDRGISREEYLKELVAADELMRKDEQIVGGCVFTLGFIGRWGPFNMNDMWDTVRETSPVLLT